MEKAKDRPAVPSYDWTITVQEKGLAIGLAIDPHADVAKLLQIVSYDAFTLM